MSVKRIRITPDQLNYEDRGKIKWQGLLLSDHSEALKKSTFSEQKPLIPSYRKQSIVEISKQLAHAYQNQYPLFVQTNTITSNQEFINFTGLVIGSEASSIYFTLKNNQLVITPLENIRYLKAIDSLSWQLLD